MNNPMTDEEFRTLAARCQEGIASDTERERFDQAYRLLLKRHETWDSTLMGDEATTKSNISKRLSENADQHRRSKKRLVFYRYASAAVLALSIGLFAHYNFLRVETVSKLNVQSESYINDIEPGSNKAVLTLADGRKIDLKGDKNGIIIQNDKLVYSDGTEIMLEPTSANGGEKAAMLNTIVIPQGGQYHVQLADGTQVWLNAASSLTYPINLKELKERKVTLRGEAYFEVAKDEQRPFIVETSSQQIRVLGTHFNVYAYEDEKITKTTLLEGLVSVSSILPNSENSSADKGIRSEHHLANTDGERSDGKLSTQPSLLLHPNQQSTLVKGSNKFQVGEVDAEEAIAWQRGYFMFNNESLESVMNKIARWYDVKVVFNNAALRKEVIYGTVHRSEKASGVLKKLELTGELLFEIKDATIYVFKNPN